MPGFQSLQRSPLTPPSYTPPTPKFGVANQPYSGAGSGTVGSAARQARYAMDTMGVPSLGELLKGGGGFGGITEFGNAGVAGQGAAFAKGELGDFKTQIGKARADYEHPTQSAGFQAGMGLATEKTAGAVADQARAAAEAAQRRGYAGGYDPRSADIDRMRALSEAGFAGVKDARSEAQAQLGAELGGYSSALDAYKGLTQTQAELPTKMLSALAPYYSSILGSGSDFFRSALSGVQGDEASARQRAADRSRQIYDPSSRFYGNPAAA